MKIALKIQKRSEADIGNLKKSNTQDCSTSMAIRAPHFSPSSLYRHFQIQQRADRSTTTMARCRRRCCWPTIALSLWLLAVPSSCKAAQQQCERLKASLTYTQEEAPRDLSGVVRLAASLSILTLGWLANCRLFV